MFIIFIHVDKMVSSFFLGPQRLQQHKQLYFPGDLHLAPSPLGFLGSSQDDDLNCPKCDQEQTMYLSEYNWPATFLGPGPGL
ncbi:hypothetical protein GDO86_016348 [Hymenochirus boettgeri]|uniref:Uncharacterized protein n=1 Tax=Hymenochirus boettgeri TaxID=247094 RepID=A0A8T2JWQ9_9PIPI|nr:hypothetical protein GDO86_016348 [Hymenochirus boettgeri]